MKEILLVGSIGIDDVETAKSKVEGAVGGAAIYFSYAASYFANVNLVGVAGSDFPLATINDLRERRVDMEGLEITSGKTFHWSGKYHKNMDYRDTLATDLNVLASFKPKIPERYKKSEVVFLANIHPSLQLDVLNQIHDPEFVVMDTMNFWLEGNRETVLEVIGKSDLLIINDSESEMLSGNSNFVAAARDIIVENKVKFVVIKLGKYGVYFTDGQQSFLAPAYPLAEVVDPTGAGDSFAGGLVGYLAKTGNYTFDNMKRAIVHGSVVATYAVSDFSVNAIKDLTKEEILTMYDRFKDITKF